MTDVALAAWIGGCVGYLVGYWVAFRWWQKQDLTPYNNKEAP